VDAERRPEEEAMNPPKVKTVNVVTMKHGEDFAEGWFDGNTNDAFERAGVITWPEWDRGLQERFHGLENDICQRVFDALKQQIAETFVRIANAVIEEERVRPEELNPPRVETVEVVTREHGQVFAEAMYQQTIGTEFFSESFGETHILIWPDDDNDGAETAAEKHFNELSHEIRDRLHEETKEVIAEAFVRVANDVISRERNRR
jgi:hypothetical protein